MNDENDRFVMEPNDFYMIDELGNKLTNEELIKYLKDNKKKLLTNKEEFTIGDWVQLKHTLEIVKVCRKDIHGFKYAGKRLDGNGNLILFNQEDIKEAVSNKTK